VSAVKNGESVAATAVSTEMIEGLNQLLRLEHDAVTACEVAIEQLVDRDNAVMMAAFKRDHESHLRELTELILRLGGVPRNEPHIAPQLKHAVRRGGDDAELLGAWWSQQLRLTNAYRTGLDKGESWPPDVRS
jgi:hypothetical protein